MRRRSSVAEGTWPASLCTAVSSSGAAAVPLVVAGLLGQIGEQVTEAAVAEPQPVMLRGVTQQYLRDGQADQLGVRQALGSARSPRMRRDDLIVEEHVQCDQKGVEVCLHKPTI